MSYSVTTSPSSPGRNAAPHGFHSSPSRSPPRCCCRCSAFHTSFGRTSSDMHPVSSYASMSSRAPFDVPDTPELCRVRRPLPPLLAMLELLPGSVEDLLAAGAGSASKQSVTACMQTRHNVSGDSFRKLLETEISASYSIQSQQYTTYQCHHLQWRQRLCNFGGME